MFNRTALSSFKKLVTEVIKASILIFLLSLLFSNLTGDSVGLVALYLVGYSIIFYFVNVVINYVKSKRAEG